MARLQWEHLMVAKAMLARDVPVRQVARQLGVDESSLRYRFARADDAPDGRRDRPSVLDDLRLAARIHHPTRRHGLRFLPGHGDPIETPAERLAELTQHRMGREAQIIAALHTAPADAATLASRIYTGLKAGLHRAATANVLAHLIDLHAQGQVRTSGALTAESTFHPT